MYELTIPAMTCGHCQKAITAAVRALDSRATLRFDMATHRVSLTTTADLNEVKQALDAAGYAAEGAAN